MAGNGYVNNGSISILIFCHKNIDIRFCYSQILGYTTVLQSVNESPAAYWSVSQVLVGGGTMEEEVEKEVLEEATEKEAMEK